MSHRADLPKSDSPKDAILHLLKMGGAQTAADLAEALSVSPMAVRQHLQRLKLEGWVLYREERRSAGRPVKLWQLAEQSISCFPDSHADLAVELLRGMEAIFGKEGLEKIIAERKRRQIQIYGEQVGQTEGWQQQVEAIARLRSQEGYMAEVVADTSTSVLLVENHCPICAAAQTCQGLCSAELEVFRAVLGPAVTVERVEHLLQGDRRCAYRIGC
ncbi:helix-turn-helix transcriptional regulator [Leptolyngbya sp. AN02str]|uniref:helix-turn-helix transcriptional regulator n=1 Tax=Leptolyngbya sp. AN02str TaxID=3423363 RepID=UPI003D31098D